MGLIFLGCLRVTRPTALTSHSEIGVFAMRHGVLVEMATLAVKSLVRRVLEIFDERGAMRTFRMAICAFFAADGLKLYWVLS
jgi:hypothetical protein